MVAPGDVATVARGDVARSSSDEAARLAAGRRATNARAPSTCTPMRARLADIYQRIAPVAEMREIGMSAVTSFAGFMKKHVLGQTLIRRNPFYYDRSSGVLERGRSAGTTSSAAPGSSEQVQRTLQLAKRTDYGRIGARWRRRSRAGRCSTRNACATACTAFTTGYKWLSAPATTGGTSGVPLKVLRSLEAIVFEQATIDRVIQSVGVDARTVRTAVLRGDNPRDIDVSPNPDCEVINAGRIMTMSANAVTHASVEHIANTLEKFAPQLLCAYPSALETLRALPA